MNVRVWNLLDQVAAEKFLLEVSELEQDFCEFWRRRSKIEKKLGELVALPFFSLAIICCFARVAVDS